LARAGIFAGVDSFVFVLVSCDHRYSFSYYRG
jgi:hypothetical protein